MPWNAPAKWCLLRSSSNHLWSTVMEGKTVRVLSRTPQRWHPYRKQIMNNKDDSIEVGVALPRLVLLRCCVCGTTTETDAIAEDPPETAEIRGTACLDCDHGGWDSPTYHRADGSEIAWSAQQNSVISKPSSLDITAITPSGSHSPAAAPPAAMPPSPAASEP
jgi:hypothetical protein